MIIITNTKDCCDTNKDYVQKNKNNCSHNPTANPLGYPKYFVICTMLGNINRIQLY